MQYVLHFPRGERYVSIIKEPEGAEERAAVHSERARLLALIDSNIANQAIVTEADEGRHLGTGKDVISQQPSAMQVRTVNIRNASWHALHTTLRMYGRFKISQHPPLEISNHPVGMLTPLMPLDVPSVLIFLDARMDVTARNVPLIRALWNVSPAFCTI